MGKYFWIISFSFCFFLTLLYRLRKITYESHKKALGLPYPVGVLIVAYPKEVSDFLSGHGFNISILG